MNLYIKRSLREWLFAWQQGHDSLHLITEGFKQIIAEPNLEGFEQSRFVFEKSSSPLHLGLQLADRSVVVRPEVTLRIPAGESTTLFVSTPLWLCPSLHNNLLLELPLYRPSDTWFGQNTTSGELCYMTKSRARTEHTASANYPHRAITEIQVENKSRATVRIDRIRVPVKNLALYEDSLGRFQSDTLLLSVHSNEKDTKMEVQKLVDQSSSRTLVSKPRFPLESGIIEQTFAKLFE